MDVSIADSFYTIKPSDLLFELDEVPSFVPEDSSLATTSSPICGSRHAGSNKKSRKRPEVVTDMKEIRNETSYSIWHRPGSDSTDHWVAP